MSERDCASALRFHSVVALAQHAQSQLRLDVIEKKRNRAGSSSARHNATARALRGPVVGRRKPRRNVVRINGRAHVSPESRVFFYSLPGKLDARSEVLCRRSEARDLSALQIECGLGGHHADDAVQPSNHTSCDPGPQANA